MFTLQRKIKYLKKCGVPKGFTFVVAGAATLALAGNHFDLIRMGTFSQVGQKMTTEL